MLNSFIKNNIKNNEILKIMIYKKIMIRKNNDV